MSAVLGLMGLKDEWPLCGVSISYALDNLVSRMVVVDHGSDSTTTHGLAALQELYGDRLQVVRITSPSWRQRSVYELGLLVLKPAPEDWIYIVDADEFLMLPAGESLLDVLEAQSSDVISYLVENWLVPSTMNLNNLDDYLEITTKSLPANEHTVSYEQITELVELRANYFDFAFQPKVINRFRAGQWYTEGAHFLRDEVTAQANPGAECTALRAAHLPFASQERLRLRVERGLETIASGAVPDFAWQSQMVARIFELGALEDFWKAHSSPASESPGVSTEQSETFAGALRPTVEALKARFGSTLEIKSLSSVPHYAIEPTIATQIFERFVHLRRVASTIQQGSDQEILRITAEHRNELSTLLNSRAWRIGRKIQLTAQFIRRLRPN